MIDRMIDRMNDRMSDRMIDRINDITQLPLHGIRVIEFSHMVRGPTCGMILADLGAEVIKVEPLTGDNTRRLQGSGAGFFAQFNRNKQSLALDVKQPAGLQIVLQLLAQADIFSENFKAGTLAALGLDEATLQRLNPRLIQVSHKGFLPGPYEQRTALDEVVQMILETAVGRARVGRDGVRWQGATTLRAHAREKEQRRQRAPVRLNRVRSAVTQEVKVVVDTKARIHAV